MTNGLCDVKDCQGLPLLGWRPLTERITTKSYVSEPKLISKGAYTKLIGIDPELM